MDFGISLDPLAVPQRHTLYDSESDSESEQQQSKADEHSSVFAVDGRGVIADGKCLTGKTLLVAVGSTASAFVKSFVHLREETLFSVRADAEVQRGKLFLSGKGEKDISLCYEVEATAEWVVCAHETELRIEYCNFWTEKVFEQGQPVQVIILICRPLHEFFNPSAGDEEYTHSMRELRSSLWPHPPINKPLHPPNSVQGETAAVLTHCELQGVPASAHILYSSSSQTETERVMAFLPTLQHPVVSHSLPIKGEKEGEVMVKKLLPKPRTDLATLYT